MAARSSWCGHDDDRDAHHLERHAVDNRLDDDTAPHELADGVANISVVAAKPIDPSHHERIPSPQHIEQSAALGALGEASFPSAVTADHVIEAYLADLAADSRTVCQLGTCCRVWPEKSLIARNARLDIATFEISPNLLGDIGAVPIDCRGRWPPPNVEVGDTLTLTGFLDNHRSKVALNRYDMQAWGGHVIAEAVSERDIVTIYEPERVLQPGPLAKPPLGFNMSGCSGGPAVLIKQINGLLRWFPVGLIYKGPDGKAEGEFAFFDRIHIRRLHFLRSDGTIDEPDIGWLPG